MILSTEEAFSSFEKKNQGARTALNDERNCDRLRELGLLTSDAGGHASTGITSAKGIATVGSFIRPLSFEKVR